MTGAVVAPAFGRGAVNKAPDNRGSARQPLLTNGAGETDWDWISYNDLTDKPTLNSGTVTSVSVTTANGVSGSVANATTTPAISLTLGNITPSQINCSTITGLSNASNPSDAVPYSQVQSMIATGVHSYAEVEAFFSTNVDKTTPGALTDGSYSVQSGDRILLTGQSTGSQNGPWVFNGAASALTRPTDYSAGSTQQGGIVYYVTGIGSSKQSWSYVLNTNAVTVDTTSTSWGTFQAAITGSSPVAVSGGVVSLTAGAVGNSYLTNSAITINGYATSLGGSVSIVPGDLGNIAAYSYLGNNTGSAAAPTASEIMILGTPGFSASGTLGSQQTGTVAGYFQNISQNLSSNAAASTDYVATANNGNDTTHYVDFGINGSNGGGAPFTAANAAYLYSVDSELDLAALGASGAIRFFTGGGTGSPTLAGSIVSGAWSIPTAGALSTAALLLNGTILTGGTGTTNVPHLWLNHGGSPASWSTSGTPLGISVASGFGGNFIQCILNTTTSFSVSAAGTINCGAITGSGNILAGSNSVLGWTGSRGYLSSSAAGVIQHGNADAASPVAQLIYMQSVVAGTTSTAGPDVILRGALSTGIALPGYQIFKNGFQGSTASAVSCTISNASPGVVTATAHGLIHGQAITFATSGALPTGLTVGTTYYVLSTGLTSSAFRVATSVEGTAINTSSAGSGSHTFSAVNTRQNPEGNCVTIGPSAIGITSTVVPAMTVEQHWNCGSGVNGKAFVVNVDNTSSSTASLLADFQVNGSSIVSINRSGQVNATTFGTNLYSYSPNNGGGANGLGLFTSAKGDSFYCTKFNHASAVTYVAALHENFNIIGSWSPASGANNFYGVSITNTINQTGTASGGYVGINYSAIETALLGATHYLMRLRAGVSGTTDKFSVSNGGTIVAAGGATFNATGLTIDTSNRLYGNYSSINAQTGTTYTLQASDCGKTITFDNGSTVTVTLPNSLTAGFNCFIVQKGGGQVVLSAASGATLYNYDSYTKLAGQRAMATLLVEGNSDGSSALYYSQGRMAA